MRLYDLILVCTLDICGTIVAQDPQKLFHEGNIILDMFQDIIAQDESETSIFER